MTGLASGKMPEAQSSDDDLVGRACAGEVSAFELVGIKSRFGLEKIERPAHSDASEPIRAKK
jgi:hypothetical protein